MRHIVLLLCILHLQAGEAIAKVFEGRVSMPLPAAGELKERKIGKNKDVPLATGMLADGTIMVLRLDAGVAARSIGEDQLAFAEQGVQAMLQGDEKGRLTQRSVELLGTQVYRGTWKTLQGTEQRLAETLLAFTDHGRLFVAIIYPVANSDTAAPADLLFAGLRVGGGEK